MPIWSPNAHGSIVSAFEAEHSGLDWRNMCTITFANPSWGSASIFCVYADSKPISGSWSASLHGYHTYTSLNATINTYDGTDAFATNFQFIYVSSEPNVQTLQMRAGSADDSIQICCTIVCSSRSGQTDPIFTADQ